jgi:hypothetical protein
LFASYGATTKIPTLWLYSENGYCPGWLDDSGKT